MNIELYIGGRLCDIGNPENLGIYLKRVFIKPSEMSVKDAQKSYEISLPATSANNEIFSYTNIEEVQGKFKMYDNARLYVDGILILDGKFRISQITRDAYIGNLGVPAPKTVKDIFGETMMNQAGKWMIPFEGVQSITDYNTGGHEVDKYGEISPCIFPLVLYKLLQKENGSTSKKDVLDDTVIFNLYDFPPSVNCVHLLRQLFKSAKYNLAGTALADERIKNLYVSYKNENNYEMPWNANIIKLKGEWTNYNGTTVEKSGTMNEVDQNVYAINLFNASNSNIQILSDNGLNAGQTGQATTVTIPYSGLYKIRLDAGIALSDGQNAVYSGEFYKVVEPRSKFKYAGIDFDYIFNLTNKRFEVKLLRNYTDLNEAKHDNTFYKDNYEQNRETKELFFPDNGKVNFIDPKQNKHMLCGFAWGYNNSTPDYKNPLNSKNCNPMAIKGGKSWDDDVTDRYFAATSSPGYKMKVGDSTSSTNILKVDLLNSFQLVDYINMATIGSMNQIVWLDKGDSLSLVATSDEGANVYDVDHPGWLRHKINFELSVTPFRHDKGWLTVKNDGSSDKAMDWNDKSTFDSVQMDLVKFLPAGIKINDWIDNFCKAFNLSLDYKNNNNFELNLKNNIINNSALLIDFDTRSDVKQCANESLNLPSVYEIGFTVDTGEEGYYETMDDAIDENGENIKVVNSGDKGGGTFYTGSEEGTKINQASNFSYNWFKTLYGEDNIEVVEVPVITDNDIWRSEYDYEETRTKEFYDKAQRLWYLSGLLPLTVGNQIDISAAKVSDSYEGKQKMVLNYKNEQDSILSNYFLMMINSDNNYTIAECYLTPQEYATLNRSLIKLNGDLYLPAEVDGYDPLNKKKCRLKLIRKTI